MDLNNTIVEKIETLRDELLKLTARNSLSSPDVVQVSVKLDLLLNEYEKYRKKNNQPWR